MANLKFATTVLFSAVLFFNSVAFAQQDAQEGIKKAIEAHGGKEALIKAQQYKRTSSGTIFFGQTQKFTDELIVSLPTKIKLDIKLDTKENLLMCMEEEKGWSIVSGFGPYRFSTDRSSPKRYRLPRLYFCRGIALA